MFNYLIPTHRFMALGQPSSNVTIESGVMLDFMPVDEESMCFKSIEITCPYCSAQLQQNWRVECKKCGWKAEAVSGDVIDHIGDINEQAEDVLDFASETYYFNSIHWLEIKRGKE